MQRQRLGRGLKALLGDFELSSFKYVELPLDSIEISDLQPRIEKEEGLSDLVESVKKHGILQPVLVRKTSHDRYRLVAGERRFIAAKMANLKSIPAVVGEWDDKTAALVSLIENVQRKDLTPIEEALYYKRLKESFSFTQDEIAVIIGKSRSHIANIMRIANLPDRIQEAILSGVISLGHAKALLSLKNEDLMLKVFEDVVKNSLSVRDTERLVRSLKNKSKEKLRELQIKGMPNVKVIIKERGKKVKLSIECTKEELKELLERLNA